MSQTSRASPYNLHDALLRFERGYIQNILTLAEGNIERTAQMLGIRPNALRRKLNAEQREQPEWPPPGVAGQAEDDKSGLNHKNIPAVPAQGTSLPMKGEAEHAILR